MRRTSLESSPVRWAGIKRQVQKRLLTIRLLNNRNMLSLYILPHLFCLIETKNFVCIVDQQVEMPEEVSPQKATNLGVESLNLCQAHDSHQRPTDGEWAGFDEIRGYQLSFGVITNNGQADVSLRREFEFCRKRRLNDRNLGARVHKEFVRPRIVDGD